MLKAVPGVVNAAGTVAERRGHNPPEPEPGRPFQPHSARRTLLTTPFLANMAAMPTGAPLLLPPVAEWALATPM